MTERSENWWVRVRYEDGTISNPTVAEVLFDGDAPQQAHLSGAYVPMTLADMGDLVLIEPVLPPGRALTVEAICRALRVSAKNDDFCFGRIQEEDDDWIGNPTGRAFTLIDGWVDLKRVAEILNGGEPKA